MAPKSRILSKGAIGTIAIHDGIADDRKLALAIDAWVQRGRLNRVAGRDPAAVLGVLEYWLAPQTGEGESRADH
jgi:hypothetical protein